MLRYQLAVVQSCMQTGAAFAAFAGCTAVRSSGFSLDGVKAVDDIEQPGPESPGR